MRTVSKRLADLPNSIIPIGFAGENLHTQVRLDSKAVFDDYPAASAALSVQPPQGMAYPVIVERDGDIVIWNVKDSDLVYDGIGEIQLTFTVGETIVKSCVGKIMVARSIVPSGNVPTPIEDWMEEANAILDAIPGQIDDALADAKESGEFDGFSPVANVTKSGAVATITITDKNGTTTATISDGDFTNVIDDTAGAGDKLLTWSADKLAHNEIIEKLRAEVIPDTVQAITYDASGNISQVTHSSGATVVRTDAFTFGTGTITEVRTLSTGQIMTLVTNTETLQTAVTYSET